MLMKHIVHVPGMISLKYGGFERFMLSVAGECAARGYQFSCVWEKKPASEQFNADLAATGANSVVISANGRRIRFILQLALWLRKNRCDVIHTHFNPVAILTLTAAKLARVPLAFSTFHSGLPPQEISSLKLRNKLSVKIRQVLSAKVFTVSAAVRKQFEQHLGLSKDKSMVRYTGVPDVISRYSREQMRHEFKLDNDELVILCVAFHDPVKGVDVLLYAFKILLAEFPNLRLVQVGGSLNINDTIGLKQLAQSIGVADKIIWTGLRNDVVEIMQCADVYCQPSRSEGLGLTILEAMYSGLAVVATRVGGIPEVVVDRETGLLVEPELPDKLAAALRELLRNKEKRLVMGQSGKKIVKQKFAIEKQTGLLLDMYEEMMK
jgi:glycosyltransferase involved in cell wall biosynthesis